MRRMSHAVPLALLVTLLTSAIPAWAADNSDDPKIGAWITQIEKLSEKGDFRQVQHERQELADYALRVGRYETAARQYELLLAARPRKADRVRLSIRLGDARMALEDYVRAIAAYDDALHDSAKDWNANISRARAFSAAELNQRAIESYQKCIHLRPREAAPYEEIAMVYERQGFLNKAISFYEQALARDTKPSLYLHMADCYAHQKNTAKAIEILVRAKARLPGADYDVRLGEIYMQLGDSLRATQAWEDALRADDKRDDVRLELTLLYDQAGRRVEADRLFKHLLSAYPQSALVHYIKAMSLFERGDRESARQEAGKVQLLSPTELVSHFNDLLLLKIRNPS